MAFGFLIWIFVSSWGTWVFWRRNATRRALKRLKAKEGLFEAFSYSVSTTLQDLKNDSFDVDLELAKIRTKPRKDFGESVLREQLV